MLNKLKTPGAYAVFAVLSLAIALFCYSGWVVLKADPTGRMIFGVMWLAMAVAWASKAIRSKIAVERLRRR
jgi:hypothetical protein